MKLCFEEYRKKVEGCYTGKSVGGTLGMKFEGDRDMHDIVYYDPVPDGMLPNDDLDLQVVNLETILRTGLPICRFHLGETWLYHLADSAPDEYGAAISNHALKLRGPLSGRYRNKFYAGMGGAIRSELWACLAPANPSLAAAFAREDACTDHMADGVYAEMFLAAVESAAFVEDDMIRLIDIGLEYVPEGNRLKNALQDTLGWWEQYRDVKKVREAILAGYGVDNWTDVSINLSFIVLALVSSRGDFDKAVCTAVSLGYDADCTGATTGAILGIVTAGQIHRKWTDPIGEQLVLSSGIINMHEKGTITDFCRTVMAVAEQVQEYYKTDVSFSDHDQRDWAVRLAPAWSEEFEKIHAWKDGDRESLAAVKPVMVSLCYPEKVAMVPGQKTEYSVKVTNTAGRALKGILQLDGPKRWQIAGSPFEISMEAGETIRIPFWVAAEESKRRVPLNILTMKFELDGLRFDAEAGLPIAMPWEVEDLETGRTERFEAENIYFTVPDGSYRYRTKLKAPIGKQVRISAGGTKAFRLLVNGEQVFCGDGSFYVPTFHRDDSWVYGNLRSGENVIQVDLWGGEGEFFLGFGTTQGCAVWLDDMERYL